MTKCVHVVARLSGMYWRIADKVVGSEIHIRGFGRIWIVRESLAAGMGIAVIREIYERKHRTTMLQRVILVKRHCRSHYLFYFKVQRMIFRALHRNLLENWD